MMKELGSGHIVDISSVAGRKTHPTLGPYSGTQLAMNAIFEALRQELIEGDVRVMFVELGLPRSTCLLHH
ncbi:MAG: SDR family NAD(P)-dependent oxidoreductase [Actinomycetota bacterium]|jgi:NADP-dependent 3-hydroxy acid dehydrogenase YdfG|nr:SDR family NAD(P)-dependent oxidoreductase [Actinomycetota bacterium]